MECVASVVPDQSLYVSQLTFLKTTVLAFADSAANNEGSVDPGIALIKAWIPYSFDAMTRSPQEASRPYR